MAPASDWHHSSAVLERVWGRRAGVLVHCGAGVSRSATLVLAYLMRRFSWNAAKARKYCFERRSLVNPNDGFWRSLCALEAQLGIADRYATSRGGRLRNVPPFCLSS